MSPEIRSIAWLCHNELRIVLRDRRTIFMSVLLPLLVWPLMLLVSRWSAERQEEKLEEIEYSYALTGPEAEAARRLIETAREGTSEDEGKESLFEEVVVADPATSLEAGEIHFYIESVRAEDPLEGDGAAAEEHAGGEETANLSPSATERGERLVPGVPILRFLFRADRDTSRSGQERLEKALRETRRETRHTLLVERGFPVGPGAVATLEETDLATPSQASGLQLGRFLTSLLMLFLLSGGAVVATDSLAGEKERGTLETLLTTAVSRFEIVAAKHLAILTVALIITVVQVANLLVYVGFELIPLPENFTISVSPRVAALLLFLYLPLASLISSVLLLASGYAKSYKEAQLYFFPIFVIGLLPTLAPFLPGLELRSAIVLVPVANLSVAVKEILAGTFDWPMIALAWSVTAAAAAYAAKLAARALSTERLITASDVDATELQGGPTLFPRRVLRWYAVLWAVFLIAAVNMEAETDLRVQLLFNMGLFVVSSVLAIRKYKLNVSEALALRPVKPVVWIAVLLGAPAALLVANGLFRLVSLFMPVPQQMLESFGQGLLPEGIPIWQLLLFLAVFPGICEEVAFRGVLLHGLRHRFHPGVLAVTVGLIFGLFHVSLFRIVPTAFLGVILAAVTILTGSIFPAMVWHTLSNAIALVAGRDGLSLEGLGAWSYVVGTAFLAAALWLLWHHRALYPGLRSGRSSEPASPQEKV